MVAFVRFSRLGRIGARRIFFRMPRLKLCSILIGVMVIACSPGLEWREVRPEGSGAVMLFPCKPKSHTRIVTLAAAGSAMTMLSCQAGDVTFALSHAELGDPSRVALALSELRLALAANLHASNVRSIPFELTGATPNPQAMRIQLAGRLPDGTPVHERAALFVRGTRVFQVAMVGARIDEASAKVFFESLRLTT
jgi:hypothetical protein